MNNEMIAPYCSHTEFRINRVTLSLGTFFLIKSISKIRHLSLLRHFQRILKLTRRFDGLQLSPHYKMFLSSIN